VVVLLMITAVWWVPLLFPGFSGDQHKNTIAFSLVFLGATVLNTQATLLTAALRARDRFLTAEIISLLGIVIALIASVVFVPVYGVWAAVWILFARSAVIYLLQMQMAGWSWPAVVDAVCLVETWRKIKPLLFSSSLVKTAPLVDRYWATLAPVGGVTVFGLAQQGTSGISAVLERAISMPLIPELSRLVDSGNFRLLRSRYRARVGLALIFCTAISGVWYAARPWLIGVMSYVLDLPVDSALLLWSLVAGLIGYVFVSIAGTVAISILYAMGEMTIAAKLSVSGFLFGVLLKWQFFEAAGLIGIAIAISISYLTTFVMTVVFVEYKLHSKQTSCE